MTKTIKMEIQSGIRQQGEELTERDSSGFTDEIERAARLPRKHVRWQSVNYGGKRYQLFGGCYTPYFICLNSPIRGKND